MIIATYVMAGLSIVISIASVVINIRTIRKIRAMDKRTNKEIANHYDRYLTRGR